MTLGVLPTTEDQVTRSMWKLVESKWYRLFQRIFDRQKGELPLSSIKIWCKVRIDLGVGQRPGTCTKTPFNKDV